MCPNFSLKACQSIEKRFFENHIIFNGFSQMCMKSMKNDVIFKNRFLDDVSSVGVHILRACGQRLRNHEKKCCDENSFVLMNFHIFLISILCGADVVVQKILQQTQRDLFLRFNNMIEVRTLVVQEFKELR